MITEEIKQSIKENIIKYKDSACVNEFIECEDKMTFVFDELFIPLFKEWMLLSYRVRRSESPEEAIEKDKEYYINVIKEL